MRLISQLRSSAALLLVVLLSGSTPLALALCASEGGHARCAVQMPPGPSASRDGCHRPQAPALNLTCCCDADDATTPKDVSGTADIPGTAKSPAAFSAGARPGVDTGIRARETSLAPAHTRPLFTLYSTFLI